MGLYRRKLPSHDLSDTRSLAMQPGLFSRARSKHHEGIEWSHAHGVVALDIAPHFHDELQIMTVEHGARGVRFGKQRDNVVAAELLLIPPGLTHGSFGCGSTPCNYRSVHLAPNRIEQLSTELFKKPGQEFLRLVRFSDQRAQSMLVRLHRALASGGGDLKCDSTLVELFRVIGGRISLCESNCVAAPKRKPALMRAREYIDANCTDTIRTVQLCEQVGLSKYYFLRLFLSTFGITPHAYHLQRRMILAKKLIAEGHALSAVAATCGFADQVISHLISEDAQVSLRLVFERRC
jgi:AraC-like DNA-binding protein